MQLVLLILSVIAVLILLAVLIVSWFLIQRKKREGKIIRSLNMSLFLITLPQEKLKEGEPVKNAKEIISIMEQFYASVSQLKEKSVSEFYYGQPVLALEIALPGKREEIRFYLASPSQ